MADTMESEEYFFILKKKIWRIIVSSIMYVLVSKLISIFVIDSVYETSTTLIVNKETENEINQTTTSENLNFVQKLSVTYGEVIKCRMVTTSAINKLNLDLTYEEVLNLISVTNVDRTQIIKISIRSNNSILTKRLCNTIPEIYAQEVQSGVKASEIEIIDKAQIPEKSVKPNKTINVLSLR